VVTNPTWCSFLHPNDIFTDFPTNEITKMSADNRHVAQHLSTSGSDPVRWTWSSGMTAILDVDYAQQGPDSGIRLWPTTWQSGTAIHCHHISCIPHQQFRCTMITYHLYFGPRSIFQVCRHVKADSHTTCHAHAVR